MSHRPLRGKLLKLIDPEKIEDILDIPVKVTYDNPDESGKSRDFRIKFIKEDIEYDILVICPIDFPFGSPLICLMEKDEIREVPIAHLDWMPFMTISQYISSMYFDL